MILGEIINIQKIIGIIIVIGGLFIAQGKNAIFGTRPRIFWYVYLLGKNFTDNFKSKNKNQKNYED
jgi:drug/metabolite transporter (DMT)-like permease